MNALRCKGRLPSWWPDGGNSVVTGRKEHLTRSSEVQYRRPVARFSLSALGTDRPGIVAAVSGALGDAGCNLEDSTMTILQGHFAILLVVSASEETTGASLESALEPVSETFDLVIAVRKIEEATQDVPERSGTDALSISIHGADRPGIVHAISGALADAGGNVVDLSTQLVGETEKPVYVMTLRAIVPPKDSDRVAVAVKTTADALGVHCTVREDESDLL
jgi:glycine cleavage system transcriptional repressor